MTTESTPPTRAARLALVAILALAAWLRLWHLDQNGYGRQYFAAGVRSMLGSWHAFFFNAFDPAGFVSLDKPPVALWLQVASAKIMGFSAFSVMLPQVLEGVVSVALIHHLVARRFGRQAGLLAALFLALTPISVAIDRSNNTDSCLIMVLLFAAWALIRAAETANPRLLAVAMALVGVGFNVKMAAALVVVPTFAAVYLCSAGGLAVRRRLAHLTLAMIVMTLVSLSWVTVFDLTPSDRRPYAGSTHHNSMLELALLHNGLDRFVPRWSRDPPLDGRAAVPPPTAAPDRAARAAGRPRAAVVLWDQTPVGPLRLLTPHLAAQMAWWLPLAVAGAIMGGAPWRRQRQLTPEQANVLVWAGWTSTYAVAFSFAGGVFHTYYVAALGPPLAALAGIGASLLWQRHRDGALPWALPAVLLITAAWHGYIDRGETTWQLEGWRGMLLAAFAGALVIAGTALWRLPRRRLGGRQSTGLALIALVVMLAMPLAWALSTVLVRPNVEIPSADLGKLANRAADLTDAEPAAPTRPRAQRLFEFLRANRQSERYLLAVPNALQASPLIVRTGESVMAMGGYLGRDPILTPGELERMVNDGALRYAIVGGPSLVPPDTQGERALADWIRTHGRRVDPVLWREPPDPSRPTTGLPRGPGTTPARLYDLRPETGNPQASNPGQ
jgi:4-amino-4-deoxy-L-arabinose transferase-like glycosyltransferase